MGFFMKLSFVSVGLALMSLSQFAQAETVSYQGVVNGQALTIQYNLTFPASVEIEKPTCEETGDCGTNEFRTEHYSLGTVSVDCGFGASAFVFDLTSTGDSGSIDLASLSANIEMSCKRSSDEMMSLTNQWMNGVVAVPVVFGANGQVTQINFPSTMPVHFGVYSGQNETSTAPLLSSGDGILIRQ
jgi:hypothetical protein